MRYLGYRKEAKETLEKNINQKAIQAIRQVMNKGIQEANKSYNESTSYIEEQRKKSFSYELHRSLTRIFKEDPIGKHIGISTHVKTLQGIYNRLEFNCGDLIISVVKSEKNKLPLKSDYKLLLSEKNLCLTNQLIIGMDYKKKEWTPNKYYALLTYDLIHDNQDKGSDYNHLDLIIPDHEYNTILYGKDILRSRNHLVRVEDNDLTRKKGFIARKISVKEKESSGEIE